MPSHHHNEDSGPARAVDHFVVSSQFNWLLKDRRVAAEALAALADEPVSPAERKRLRQLIDALDTDAADGDAAGKALALVNRLSSRQLLWLPSIPAEPMPDSKMPDSKTPEAESQKSPCTVSQTLVAVAQSVHEPPHVRFRAVLIYPLIVLGFSMLVVIGLALIVVPPFEHMFDEFGLSLPAPTRGVIAISRLFRAGPWFWFSTIFLGTLLIIGLVRLRPRLSRLGLALGFRRRGSTDELIAMSRFIRTVAEMIQANTPPADAIRVAAIRCEHPYYKKSAILLANEAQRMPGRLRDVPVSYRFPANFIVALSDGDQASARPSVPLLRTLADVYDERAAGRLQDGETVPAMLTVVAVGLVVGFVTLSLFMPLVTLITALS